MTDHGDEARLREALSRAQRIASNAREIELAARELARMPEPSMGLGGVRLYRVQTACDRAGRWQIEAFVSEQDEADRMVDAFEAQGERANVTTIDLTDPLERDSVCHNLTAFFQTLKATREGPTEPTREELFTDG